MGGPDRQTTPRTGLDDFVAGLLKYGTLGYLPPDVLNQLFPPTPGAGGGGAGGGGGQPNVNPGTGGHGFLDAQPPQIGPTGPGGPSASIGIADQLGITGNNNSLWEQLGITGNTQQGIPAGSQPFDIGKFIQGRLSVPQYGGQFTAPINALQNTAAAGAGSSLASFFSPRPPNIHPPMFGAPPVQPGGGGGAGGFTGPGAGMTIGNDIISQLMGRGAQGSQTGERTLLDILGMQGPQANLSAAFQALDAQRRTGLAQDTRDLREQFSFSGNRFGTDLANAITKRQGESEQNFMAQAAPLAASLAPQMFGQQVSALGTAGQLGQGAGQQSLEALLGLPGAFSQTSMLPGQVASQGFNLGEQLRQIMQGDTSAKQAEFTRTQGALFPTLLQYAAGAPQIYTPGIGQQLLGAGTAVGGAALGAK